jgi:hypothetical protein
MTILSAFLWVAATAAGVLALTQVARHAARLREELDELRARVPEPARDARPRLDVQPLFGQLYEDKPSPLEEITSWPGVPLALAAAGLFAIGMFTGRPRQAPHGQVDSTVAVELAAARLRYDSLESEVDQLRDSVASLQKPGAQVRSAHAGAPAPVKRGSTTALALPAAPKASGIAPLPSLPNVDGAP